MTLHAQYTPGRCVHPQAKCGSQMLASITLSQFWSSGSSCTQLVLVLQLNGGSAAQIFAATPEQSFYPQWLAPDWSRFILKFQRERTVEFDSDADKNKSLSLDSMLEGMQQAQLSPCGHVFAKLLCLYKKQCSIDNATRLCVCQALVADVSDGPCKAVSSHHLGPPSLEGNVEGLVVGGILLGDGQIHRVV